MNPLLLAVLLSAAPASKIDPALTRALDIGIQMHGPHGLR